MVGARADLVARGQAQPHRPVHLHHLASLDSQRPAARLGPARTGAVASCGEARAGLMPSVWLKSSYILNDRPESACPRAQPPGQSEAVLPFAESLLPSGHSKRHKHGMTTGNNTMKKLKSSLIIMALLVGALPLMAQGKRVSPHETTGAV